MEPPAAALSRGDAAKAHILRTVGEAMVASYHCRGKDWCLLPHPDFIVSFTAATSWLRVNGFGRKSNCWPSGRLFSKASSA